MTEPRLCPANRILLTYRELEKDEFDRIMTRLLYGEDEDIVCVVSWLHQMGGEPELQRFLTDHPEAADSLHWGCRKVLGKEVTPLWSEASTSRDRAYTDSPGPGRRGSTSKRALLDAGSVFGRHRDSRVPSFRRSKS